MADVQMFDAFSTPLLHGKLSQEAVENALSGVKTLREKYPVDPSHPFHCDIWTTYDCEKRLFDNPAFALVTNEVNELAQVYCRNRKAKVAARMAEFWANVQDPGQFQETHHHRGRMFSGALYLKVPDHDSGSISFSTPRTHLFDDGYWGCDADKEYITILPEVGDVLIFPSWLLHGTRPVQEQRISLAFNYVAEKDAPGVSANS